MPIPKKKVKKFAKNWQRCTPTQMADLFYAYDKKEGQTERVVSYRLSEAGVERLRALDQAEMNTLRLVMACKKPRMNGLISNRPGFAPILAVDSLDAKTEFFELNWEPNPHFLTNYESPGKLPGSTSGIDAIPPAGAFLFVFNWMAQKYYELPLTFEHIFRSVAKRVESYIYIPEETKMISDKVKEANKAAVYIHLGVGISIATHPFSFRPVIEIHEQKTKKKATKGNKEEDPTEDPSFFDFSRPCPPYCKPKTTP